jgi:putative thioredoxin
MMDLTFGQKTKPPEPGAFIRDTDASRFEEEVLAVSMTKPVIVDFWAPWCGPCKQMMPALEKAVNDAAGDVHLVKVNVDKSPELAEAFRVQSVPTVYAFFQGQPVDGFMGAKNESDLKAFIEKLKKIAGAAPKPAENPDAVNIAKLLEQAEGFFKQDNFNDAIALYSTVYDAAPDNMDALAGIGWSLVGMRELEGIGEMLQPLTEDQKKHAGIKGLVALSVIVTDAAGIDAGSLLAKLDKNPKDHAARYDLARAQVATGDVGAAIDSLIELTRRDREWQDQKARKLLLELFDAMGPKHPLTAAGRRKLSSVLFS